MPRPPQFRTSSIRNLLRQLSYASAETRRRLLERAESLAGEIDPDRAYPEDFIVFRITGYRPESGDAPMILAGEALLADLATFVQELSRTVTLPVRCERRGAARPVEELARELGVAVRTLRRYRKRGLLFHYVAFNGRTERLACYEQALDVFSRNHPDLMPRAQRFSRMDPAQVDALIREAIALHEQYGWTRQKIARRLARRHGRSVEAIRSHLARCERASDVQLFAGRRRTSARERRFMERAWQWGIGLTEIAEHLGRSTLTVRRAVNRYRLRRIRSWNISHVELATFRHPEAAEVILSAPQVIENLPAPETEVDAVQLIEGAADAKLDADAEAALVAGYNLLKRRVSAAVGARERVSSDHWLDELERDLRWAALLKRALVQRTLWATILRTNHTLNRPLHQQPSDMIRKMIILSIQELSRSIEAINPGQRQTLARVAGLSMDRRLAQMNLQEASPDRAGVRHAAGGVMMEDPFADLCPWQADLELSAEHRRRLGRLDEAEREVVDVIYGLRGNRPRSVEDMAAESKRSARTARRMLSEARGRLRGPREER